ncbi:MAG: hypothetical protein U0807_06235 [Candidatus Binatia bacterium]
MASQRRWTRERVDGDGVRILEAPGVRTVAWVLVSAVGVVAIVTVVALVVIRRAPAAPPAGSAALERDVTSGAVPSAGTTRAPGESPPTVSPTAHAKPAAVARAKEARGAPPSTPEPPSLEAKDVIPMLRSAGEQGGIAVFPLPGTKPIKQGIVVPEDFELPPGYVRHYQTTDDGKQLPAVLMFHPDFEFVDESGRVVPLPESRIVPPELAPPGLPLRMLDVPKAPGGSDRAP